MSDRRLKIYVDDHLAVMTGEIELARRCRSENPQAPLGPFLENLIADLHDQRSLVGEMLRQIGGSPSRLKSGLGWLAEKMGRFKLNDSWVRYSDLSRLLELENLAMAALERVALWENLQDTRSNDDRMSGIHFSHLRDQSQQHLNEINSHRRSAASRAL